MVEKIKLMEEDLSCPVGLEALETKDPKSLDLDHGFCLCLVCYEKHRLWEEQNRKSQGGEVEEEESEELQSLRAETKNYEDLEKTYEEMEQLCEDQAAQCELQVREEFCRLHSFLQEEEERALTAVREERLIKTGSISLELQEVREKLKCLRSTVQELKKDLQTDRPQPQSPVNRLRPKAAPILNQRPCLRPKAGLLLDQARVLGNLGFRVWRNMRRIVSFSPVILDPNTAHGILVLSEDLRGLRERETKQKVPDNPERFTRYATVLGSEGFSSGTHQWDVEVRDHPDWIIGVTRESAERKESRSLSTREGSWCLFHQFEGYANGCGRKVPVQVRPQRLRVKLDYDQGKVSFYDADHMTHLYTHSDRFTERLFPFVCLNRVDPNNPEIRILPCEPDRGETLGKTSPGTKLLSVFKSVKGMLWH